MSKDRTTADELKEAFQTQPREPQFRGLEVIVWTFLCGKIDALRKENAEMAARVAIRAFAAKKAGGV